MNDAGVVAAAARLEELGFWPSKPVFEPIPGGRTNLNFAVRCGERKYFARVGHDLPHHRISRKTELRCLQLAADADVAPPVLHAADGLLVTEFVEGRTLVQGEPVGDDVLVQIAMALDRIWRSNAPEDLPAFDPVEICRGYIESLPPGTHDAARQRTIEAILGAAPARDNRYLVHADLIPENVIVTQGRLYIVDWEYAGRGDKAVDVAAVAMNFGLDARQTRLFRNACAAHDGSRIDRFERMMALREALWCDTQRHFVGVKGDLDAYSELCWRRIDGLAR